MWNERFEMLENPIKMKLYYSSEETTPKPCQPLIDVYKKMKEAESSSCQKCKREEDSENE